MQVKFTFDVNARSLIDKCQYNQEYIKGSVGLAICLY
jgi:hypothetical protein